MVSLLIVEMDITNPSNLDLPKPKVTLLISSHLIVRLIFQFLFFRTKET